MIWLARLLIREKWRKFLAQYGPVGCAALGAMLSGFAVAAGVAAAHHLQTTPPLSISEIVKCVWLPWVIAGLLLGRDLSWRIRLDHLLIFPHIGFARLYLIWLFLGYFSIPLMLGMIGVAVAGAILNFSRFSTIIAAFLLVTTSVRLTVSLGRAALCRSSALARRERFTLAGIVSTLGVFIASPSFHPGIPVLFPGSGLVLLLAIIDFGIQRRAVYSGDAGPPASDSKTLANGKLLLIHPAWPPPIWRISLLGWLRHRNALLMFVFGTIYCFCFVYFTRPAGLFLFYGFIWMALVYHAYLRGNLLGVDQEGVWLYYLLPQPVEISVRAKNQTLSFLQAGMAAAVIMPALFHPVRGTDTAAWLCLVSFAYSSLLLGEIAGGYFSLRFPEPIERSAHFSGGMTAGALIIPFLNLLFVLVYVPAAGWMHRSWGPVVYGLLLISVPGFLCLIRIYLLPGWIRQTMVKEIENLISKLRVHTS